MSDLTSYLLQLLCQIYLVIIVNEIALFPINFEVFMLFVSTVAKVIKVFQNNSMGRKDVVVRVDNYRLEEI